jgi:hypothetical protein
MKNITRAEFNRFINIYKKSQDKENATINGIFLSYREILNNEFEGVDIIALDLLENLAWVSIHSKQTNEQIVNAYQAMGYEID